MNVRIKAGDNVVSLNESPFKLTKHIDLSGMPAVHELSTSSADGAKRTNTRYDTRDIEIEAAIISEGQNKSWIQQKRNELYTLFNPKQEIEIEIDMEGETYTTKGFAISTPVFGNDKATNNSTFTTFLVQIVCLDPFLYKESKHASFSTTEKLFSFPLEFNKTVLGEKRTVLTQNIFNNGTESPVQFIMRANGDVVTSPFILNTTTNQRMQFNDTLAIGEEIIVETGTNKRVYKVKNGIKTIYFDKLDLYSDFITLQPGDNLVTFGAAGGTETRLEIEFNYNERVLGV